MNRREMGPLLPKYFFVIPVRKNYAHTCFKCFTLMKGLEFLCGYDIFRSILVFIILISLAIVDRTQADPRTFFRILQVLYGVPATLCLYGLEKLRLRWVLYYYYVKLFEFLSTVIRDIMLLAAGICPDANLLTYIEGYCFTGLDVCYMVVELLLLMYESYLIFSFVNLTSTGAQELVGIITNSGKGSTPIADPIEIHHNPIPSKDKYNDTPNVTDLQREEIPTNKP